jgi:hypothetical protein
MNGDAVNGLDHATLRARLKAIRGRSLRLAQMAGHGGLFAIEEGLGLKPWLSRIRRRLPRSWGRLHPVARVMRDTPQSLRMGARGFGLYGRRILAGLNGSDVIDHIVSRVEARVVSRVIKAGATQGTP